LVPTCQTTKSGLVSAISCFMRSAAPWATSPDLPRPITSKSSPFIAPSSVRSSLAM
jgi:hypothetical protein